MSKSSDKQAPKVEPVIFPERGEPFDLTSFKCPRCSAETNAEYYGPCESCLAALNKAYANDGGPKDSAEAEQFMPKMHVTPNAVALKDD